jgi:hypothetical protein
MLCIKYLDKPAVLHALWQHARYLPHIFAMEEKPHATYAICKRDIQYMGSVIKLTTYYGKRINVDLSGDLCDIRSYEAEHGPVLAIIQQLQTEQVKQCVCVFYKHH